ncbi:phosphoribosylformylglycinamidine synthase [Glaesserella parasuis ZJ0906]|uniref:Phosphoribosylformylglycinamidine synthase n=1 Tax=Glaesserella parasuis ZJ0906 TaxID=1322346 RepID=A0A806JBN4_GLAPU|nr:phosphoribosylformylglycinamidine synthase [Glaesserella parasuis ZJ0906]
MKKIMGLLLMLFSFNAFAEENKNLADIQFKDLDNNIVSLEKYKGKNVYVKMWASWCPICLAGLAEIDDLSADQNKNFEVITIVSPDKKGKNQLKNLLNGIKDWTIKMSLYY